MKTALITGAARGIGLATTKQFLEAGWRVIMVDRDEAALEDAAAPLDDTLSIVADVSDKDQVATLAAAHTKIDALINNAGVADFGPIEETDFTRWRNVMETNLDGVFLMTQAFTAALATTQGSIVNIASISGLRASTLRVAYGTSKAGVIALTQQQAVELGE
ncbi:MAG: SDR family oxidoreductase, partial [Pseudomonadota bacterium]